MKNIFFELIFSLLIISTFLFDFIRGIFSLIELLSYTFIAFKSCFVLNETDPKTIVSFSCNFNGALILLLFTKTPFLEDKSIIVKSIF